jgi:hypothetical protein
MEGRGFNFRRCRWLRGVRCRFVATRLLGLRVRIPLRVWMFVLCVFYIRDAVTSKENEEERREKKMKKKDSKRRNKKKSGCGLCYSLLTRFDSNFNRYEYQGHSLGGLRRPVCRADKLITFIRRLSENFIIIIVIFIIYCNWAFTRWQ